MAESLDWVTTVCVADGVLTATWPAATWAPVGPARAAPCWANASATAAAIRLGCGSGAGRERRSRLAGTRGAMMSSSESGHALLGDGNLHRDTLRQKVWTTWAN